MEDLFIYLLKSALCTALFFGVYWCFLRNETFYKFNRYFLLSGLVCSLVLPFYQYTYLVKLDVPAEVSRTLGMGMISAQPTLSEALITFLGCIYVLIICVLVIRHIVGFIRIKHMVGKYGYALYQGCKVITSAKVNTSFSVFNYIFIQISKDTSETEKNLILEHELAHIKQVHWLDLLIVQAICSLQWFNPFAWLYMHFIKQNHEFLADKEVLENGNSPAAYRAVLINHSLKTPVFILASSFASSSRFKRINMMLKPSSNPIRKLMVLLVLPVIALIILAFAEPTYVVTRIKKPGIPAADRVVKKLEVPEKKSWNLTASSKPLKKSKVILSLLDTMRVKSKNIVQVITNDTTKQIASLNPAAPILLVDGLERNIDINSLNPNDIASISVFKGADAIAKYGPRGVNGVILVTTKKGE